MRLSNVLAACVWLTCGALAVVVVGFAGLSAYWLHVEPDGGAALLAPGLLAMAAAACAFLVLTALVPSGVALMVLRPAARTRPAAVAFAAGALVWCVLLWVGLISFGSGS